MKTLIVVPIQPEFDFLLQAWAENGFHTRNAIVGRLPVVCLPELDVTLACGGLGKVQFAVQTQHLLDVRSTWDLIICAGAAGALVDGLSVGDVVVATETDGERGSVHHLPVTRPGDDRGEYCVSGSHFRL